MIDRRRTATAHWQVLAAALCVGAPLRAAGDAPDAVRPRLSVSQEADGVTVSIDGKVFTRYLKRFGSRPVLWPLMGPTDKPVTRSYPVGGRAEGEETDHPHHTSMWVGYAGLNGYDFWCQPEPGVKREFEIGTVAHREFVRADSDGDAAVIGARNDWLDPSGHAVAHDERLLTFSAQEDMRQIDFRIRLWGANRPLVVGDSKEGFFGVRVASTMRVEAGLGGKLVNSRGEANADAYGQPAEWVDYHGPIDGETVGIALLAHPSSYKPSPRWFVRPYGLLAVNPFGVVGYTEDPAGAHGGVSVPAGESLELWYRLILHRGDERQANIATAFAAFAKEREDDK